MAHCPKCGRNSLEYSERRSEAWCLYSDCAFSQQVATYNEFVTQFEKSAPCQSFWDERDKEESHC